MVIKPLIKDYNTEMSSPFAIKELSETQTSRKFKARGLPKFYHESQTPTHNVSLSAQHY